MCASRAGKSIPSRGRPPLDTPRPDRHLSGMTAPPNPAPAPPRLEALKRRLLRPARTRLRDLYVNAHSRHVFGPRRVDLPPDGCAMVMLLRDAAYFLEPALAHHRALGVSHTLIIDNGSTDATVEIARRHPDVTVIRNTLPPKRYETALRRASARRHIRGGWLLFVDADELFMPPTEGQGGLHRLIRYCNASGFTAVQCQMLDLFSELPLSATTTMPYAESLHTFHHYSRADIAEFAFHDPALPFAKHLADSRCDDPGVRFLYGGIRKRVFGEDACLSKMALVRNLPGIGLQAHPHCSERVVCADLTALLRHYKYCGDLQARDADLVARRTWWHGGDVHRLNRLRAEPDLLIDCPGAEAYTGPAALVANGFLHLSPAARRALEAGRDP